MKKIDNLDELKKIELDILVKIDAFCREHNIHYFLSHGTLLGAVRHQGFIPWDDDIDIFMLRTDYKKFCVLFPRYAQNENLALANSHTPIYFGRAYSKVIDTRTKLSELEYSGDDDLGVFIDIWPLDALPQNKILRKKQFIECRIINSLYYNKIIVNKKKRKKLIYFISKFFPKKLLLDRMEKTMQKYSMNSAREVTCFVDPYRKSMKKSLFEKSIEMDFENHKLMVPKQYDKVLKILYGNYMKLPPVQEQVPQHIMNVYWR